MNMGGKNGIAHEKQKSNSFKTEWVFVVGWYSAQISYKPTITKNMKTTTKQQPHYPYQAVLDVHWKSIISLVCSSFSLIADSQKQHNLWKINKSESIQFALEMMHVKCDIRHRTIVPSITKLLVCCTNNYYVNVTDDIVLRTFARNVAWIVDWAIE